MTTFCESSDIIKNLNILIDKLDLLNNRIDNIEKKIESNDKIIEVNNLKELKKEEIELDEKFVLNSLKFRDYRSVLIIFKKYYMNKTNENYSYPIRITGKRKYEYYFNKRWNADLYGSYSREIIMLNIQNLFIKYNIFDEREENDNFLLNQEFIIKLSNEKYQKEIFKNIIEEIKINS